MTTNHLTTTISKADAIGAYAQPNWTDDQIDHMIASLVRLRHSRIRVGDGYQPVPAYVTVLTERDGEMTLASIGTMRDLGEHAYFAESVVRQAFGLPE